LVIATTDLRRDDAWFWDVTPRKFFAMIESRRKMDMTNYKIQSYLNRGGEIESGESESGTPGIDFPASPEIMRQIF